MTMLKSGKVVHLFYDIKTYLLLGYAFDNSPVELHFMIEVMQQFIPPRFDVVGNFQQKLNGRALFEIVNSYTKQDDYRNVQQALKIK